MVVGGYVDVFSDPEEFEDEEAPWTDLVFDLVAVELNRSDSGIHSISFEMRGLNAGEEVGLGVILNPDRWEVAGRDDFLVTYGLVTLRSIGAPSDRLLRLYEARWGTSAASRPCVDAVTVSTAGINCHPADCETSKIHLKVFFEPKRPWVEEGRSDPAYAELFVNFDIEARRGWLLEKGESYREAVVGWLSGLLHADVD